MPVAQGHAVSIFEKGGVIMKKLVSFVLGGALLLGAATFGLQSGTANARDRHDRNYWRHHHRHHHRNYRRNRLSW